jgi:hypothetical protein
MTDTVGGVVSGDTCDGFPCSEIVEVEEEGGIVTNECGHEFAVFPERSVTWIQ